MTGSCLDMCVSLPEMLEREVTELPRISEFLIWGVGEKNYHVTQWRRKQFSPFSCYKSSCVHKQSDASQQDFLFVQELCSANIVLEACPERAGASAADSARLLALGQLKS